MLVHRRVTPSSVLPVPINTPGWRETNWSKVPCLRKQRDGRGWNPRTSRSGVRGVNHSVTHASLPVQSCCRNFETFGLTIVLLFVFVTRESRRRSAWPSSLLRSKCSSPSFVQLLQKIIIKYALYAGNFTWLTNFNLRHLSASRQ